jgi:hypothetical protein
VSEASPNPGREAARPVGENDPLYYLWSACWAWLTSSVPLLSVVVSLASPASGLWVHLGQAGQAVLFVFLAWLLPRASLKLGESQLSTQSDFAGFWRRWVRISRPRAGFQHEWLRLAPVFVLVVILLSWHRQTAGQVSIQWPVMLIALIAVSMFSAVPFAAFRTLRTRAT